jgi:hypothetical protein
LHVVAEVVYLEADADLLRAAGRDRGVGLAAAWEAPPLAVRAYKKDRVAIDEDRPLGVVGDGERQIAAVDLLELHPRDTGEGCAADHGHERSTSSARGGQRQAGERGDEEQRAWVTLHEFVLEQVGSTGRASIRGSRGAVNAVAELAEATPGPPDPAACWRLLWRS